MIHRIIWWAAAVLALFATAALPVVAQAAPRPVAQLGTPTMSGPWKPGPIVAALSAAPELSQLQAFTAPVLLPASDSQPFAALPLAAAPYGITADQASYTVYLGSSDGWRIAGARGRDTYDAIGRSAEGGLQGDCTLSMDYCDATRAEFFRGLQVNGTAAVVVHFVGLSDESNFWDLAWYDEGADATYSLASGDAASSGAATAFAGGRSASHRADAVRLTELAGRLVIWTADAQAPEVAAPVPVSGDVGLADLASFVGVWEGHQRRLEVRADGSASMVFGSAVGPDLNLTLKFTTASPTVATGQVVVSNSPRHPIGEAATLTLNDDGTVSPTLGGEPIFDFCGPNTPAGYCGA